MKSLVLLFVALFFGSCTVKGNTNEMSGVSPQEAYSKGKAYFLAQNYSDALTWAKKAADGKYCPAYVLMAEIYDGTPIDDLQRHAITTHWLLVALQRTRATTGSHAGGSAHSTRKNWAT